MDRYMFLPSHCFKCGAPLRGGATIHSTECPLYELIRDWFKPQRRHGYEKAQDRL